MTSSKDNKDSSLPHAASRLVLYTKLKKGDKKQQTKREKEQRKKKKKEVERNREEVDSEEGMGVRVVVLGLNWPAHLGRCDVLP